jgi:hypothetical protein
LNGKGNKQAARATMVKTGADAHEKGRSDRATNGDQLDLTVPKMTLKVVGISSYHTFLYITGALIFESECFRHTAARFFVLVA